MRNGPSRATLEHTDSLWRTFCTSAAYVTSEGTTTTNISFPYVILTLRADVLSRLPVEEPGVEGTALRVADVDVEDAEEGVSGMEENALV